MQSLKSGGRNEIQDAAENMSLRPHVIVTEYYFQ